VVERLLAKEKVTSSNLVARSRIRQALSLPDLFLATWPSGKAEVCKTSITGSNPVVAFLILQALALPQELFCFQRQVRWWRFGSLMVR
jgi:hypothetical protein